MRNELDKRLIDLVLSSVRKSLCDKVWDSVRQPIKIYVMSSTSMVIPYVEDYVNIYLTNKDIV